MESNVWRRVEESARDIQAGLGREVLPDTLLVLGSGFKGFESRLQGVRSMDCSEVAHFPVPQVEGHGSALVVGSLGDREVAVLTGRVHLYEGWTAGEVVYPLRVCSTLGVQRLVLTNAAGSVDPAVPAGTAVLVRDHINLTGHNCLIGPEAREFGATFVDMSRSYDESWRRAVSRRGGVVEGVYAGLTGPTYETPAETAMLGRLGATVVGMSTVQETIAARQLGMRVVCLSFVTNMAGGLGGALSHQEVLDLAAKHRQSLHDLLQYTAAWEETP